MSLPDIDPENITSLTEAKSALYMILDHFEESIKLFNKQQEEIERLKVEIRRLKGQPKKPQFASSNHKQQATLRDVLKEKTPWHKQGKGKLPIDRQVQLSEVDQCSCGSREFRVLRTTTKVVQGISLQRNNVAYHGRHKQCLGCGKTYKSSLPEELKGISFDPRLQSLLSYLKFSCRMTYPLILRMLTGFGTRISNGEVNEILLRNGARLQEAHHHLKTIGFAKSSHLQSDVTGAKRKGKQTGKITNQYAQVIGNKLLSVFSITRYYNIETLNRLLGRNGRNKPFVSDDGSSNSGCRCSKKQLCWVHEIRHYKKLFPFFNPHHKLQDQILLEWSQFYHLAKTYGHDPTEEKRQEIEDLFDRITSQITIYGDLNKQLKLTRRKKEKLLLFLNHPYLPIHNNQCEQDLRQFVIMRKISGETKSTRGDRSLERHLSIIQTAQKQGLDVFATLHGLLTGQLSPAVLTANIS